MTVTLDRVTRSIGKVAHVQETTLSLEPGSLNVLLGPTLSGKTSLMRLLAGLDAPTTGRIVVNGKDVTGLHVRERSVAMVYQQFINYPSLTVYENIASPLRVKGLGKAEIDKKVTAAADLLRLTPYLARTPLNLSGGQQQRCAIARALVKNADMVLMDEPLANLDYKLREELREELPRLFSETGAIFVYATTEPTEALLLGGNTACLHEGAITQFGPTARIYRHPSDLTSARVFSDPPLNVMAVTKAGDHITLPSGQPVAAMGPLKTLKDGAYHVGVRAHHVTLKPHSPAHYRLSGTVDVTEITGSESYVHVHSGPLRWVALAPGVHEIAPGAPIDIHVEADRLFVFDAQGRLAIAGAAATI
jgi:glycerol transport system ATP-binding protein